jgi:hypothetical protein
MQVMARRKPNGESRAGMMAPGWTRHSLQIPHDLRARLSQELGRRGHSGGKITGSVAVALFIGLPEDVRELMYLWGVRQAFDDPNKLTPEAAWEAFARIAKVCAEQARKDRERIEREPGAGPPAIDRIDRFLTLIIDPDFDWSVLDRPASPAGTPADAEAKRKRASA